MANHTINKYGAGIVKVVYQTCLIICTSILAAGCQKFLDVNSDKALSVPHNLKDAQALLDNEINHSSIGDQSDDNYYITDSYFNTLKEENQINYIWEKESYNELSWKNLYLSVLYANLALETMQNIERNPYNKSIYDNVKGQALFLRGNAFFYITQFWAAPYQKEKAMEVPGIPLRLSTDGSIPSKRGTLSDSYTQILADLHQAAALLDVSVPISSRPSKAAAFGVLARTYLIMGDFVKAGLYADSCLQLKNYLIDFNQVSQTANAPFSRFNAEVIFDSKYLGTGMLGMSQGIIDSNLYMSYATNDLRKVIYFKSNGAGTFGRKGDYATSTSGTHFDGLAVDEIYLIRAEAYARQGKKTEALADLNALLQKRWKANTFIPYSVSSAEEALVKILEERRKELVMRGLRWFDLRRLNLEDRFQKTLVRIVNGKRYELPPNDNRYVFFIPQAAIAASGLEQNKR